MSEQVDMIEGCTDPSYKASADARAGTQRVKTNCHFCGYLCGLEAVVEDGRVVDLEPDPSRYPYDERILKGCPRWSMNLEVLDGPDRVNWPLRRVGERGSGQWERISWEEALDEIAQKLEELRTTYNPGVLASMIGGPHTSFWPLHRFMSLFGSPNNMGIGQICWNPRIWMDAVTFGWTIEPDINRATNTIMVWGTNPAESDNSVFWRELMKISRSGSSQVFVIDPRFTKTARIAHEWIAIKPGTDCTFALGLINEIIAHDLYDHEFVETWCVGFEELKEHVAPYTLEYVSEICGIPAEQIAGLARAFAQGRSAIVSGRGIDQVGRNVAPTHRARCILLAITGNIDRPGASLVLEQSDFVPELDLEMTLERFDELNALCLNTEYTPLQSYEGYKRVRALTGKLDRALPARYLTSAHPDLVLEAMERGRPYPVRALIIEATNPLVTYADTNRVLKALLGLDLIVALDYYITPSSALADYILPSAGAIERATFQAHGGVANFVYGGGKAVEPYYERKNDYEIFRELGMRLGQADDWPEKSFEEACAATLAPCDMSFDQYCTEGMYAGASTYCKHELPDEQGRARGFATETGKIELASTLLPTIGGDALPEPAPATTLCSTELKARLAGEGFVHLSLITGGRKQPYNASMYLNNPAFRTRVSAPVVQMSEATASRLGCTEGDTVLLVTDQGEARFVVSLVRMVDDVVHADYGWWHPENDIKLPELGGIFESNVNTLTSCSLEQGEPMIGTWSYNAMDCMIKRVDDELTWSSEMAKRPLDGLVQQ